MMEFDTQLKSHKYNAGTPKTLSELLFIAAFATVAFSNPFLGSKKSSVLATKIPSVNSSLLLWKARYFPLGESFTEEKKLLFRYNSRSGSEPSS